MTGACAGAGKRAGRGCGVPETCRTMLAASPRGPACRGPRAVLCAHDTRLFRGGLPRLGCSQAISPRETRSGRLPECSLPLSGVGPADGQGQPEEVPPTGVAHRVPAAWEPTGQARSSPPRYQAPAARGPSHRKAVGRIRAPGRLRGDVARWGTTTGACIGTWYRRWVAGPGSLRGSWPCPRRGRDDRGAALPTGVRRDEEAATVSGVASPRLPLARGCDTRSSPMRPRPRERGPRRLPRHRAGSGSPRGSGVSGVGNGDCGWRSDERDMNGDRESMRVGGPLVPSPICGEPSLIRSRMPGSFHQRRPSVGHDGATRMPHWIRDDGGKRASVPLALAGPASAIVWRPGEQRAPRSTLRLDPGSDGTARDAGDPLTARWTTAACSPIGDRMGAVETEGGRAACRADPGGWWPVHLRKETAREPLQRVLASRSPCLPSPPSAAQPSCSRRSTTHRAASSSAASSLSAPSRSARGG